MSNSAWLTAQSGTSESKPWQVPPNRCRSVRAPQRISCLAYSTASSRSGSNSEQVMNVLAAPINR